MGSPSMDSDGLTLRVGEIALYSVLTGKPYLVAEAQLQGMSAQLRERVFRALQEQGGTPILYDPIENESAFAALKVVIEKLAWARVVESGIAHGRSAYFWVEKRKIVQQTLGLRWYSPAEMNPGYQFHPG